MGVWFGLAVWGEQLIRVFRGSYDQTFGVNFSSAGQGENDFKDGVQLDGDTRHSCPVEWFALSHGATHSMYLC